MYGRTGFPSFPPNYHPGMPRPPYPFPDQRYRGHPPPPNSRNNQPQSGDRERGDREGDETYKRPAIIKDKDLKEFDELLRTEANDGGWAGATGEIDYTEKLVFSDDEDSPNGNKDRK